MLNTFSDFRNLLDNIIIRCLDKRIVLYGYDKSGQFLQWYADYYHSIQVDYIITEDWRSGNIPYNFPVFRDSLFKFDFKDVPHAIVWLTADNTNRARSHLLEEYGYIENQTYYDFRHIVYGENLLNLCSSADIFSSKASLRGISFMEYAEYRHGINLISPVHSRYFQNSLDSAHSYYMTSQKEIFPILDKLHHHPSPHDAIFDFGCGKGGALLTFLDYGFTHLGGVEYEDGLYEVLTHNFQKMHLLHSNRIHVELFHADASTLNHELDKYNFFYYFDPFEEDVFISTIGHICDSLTRNPRQITLICINPAYHRQIMDTNHFHLVNSVVTNTKQKVCNIYKSKE